MDKEKPSQIPQKPGVICIARRAVFISLLAPIVTVVAKAGKDRAAPITIATVFLTNSLDMFISSKWNGSVCQ